LKNDASQISFVFDHEDMVNIFSMTKYQKMHGPPVMRYEHF